MKASSKTSERCLRLLSILTKHRLVTTDPACASCCSCRAVCCDARIAITRIRGISRTAPTFRPAGARSPCWICAGAARAWWRSHDIGRRTDGAARVHQANSGRRQGNGPAHGDRDIGLSRVIVPTTTCRARSGPARHQELESRHLSQGDGPRPGADAAFCRAPRLDGQAGWVRFTLVPAQTDDPANVEGIARFVAPMKNVEWVEVQPFHQMGAFKWKAMKLDYKHADTPTATPDLIARVIEQFRAAGCRVR